MKELEVLAMFALDPEFNLEILLEKPTFRRTRTPTRENPQNNKRMEQGTSLPMEHASPERAHLYVFRWRTKSFFASLAASTP